MPGALHLENSAVFFELTPGRGLFSVAARQHNTPAIRNAHLSLSFRTGSGHHRLGDGPWSSEDGVRKTTTAHGELRAVTARCGHGAHGLVLEATFGVCQDHPLLLWQLRVANEGTRPVEIDRIEMLRLGFATADQANLRASGRSYPRGSFVFQKDDADPAFFSNGWGSWNHTGAYGLYDRFRRTRLGFANGPMRVNPGTPQPGGHGHFASDMFGVLADRTHRGALLLGFLSQKRHFGSLEALIDPAAPALSLWANADRTRLEPGSAMMTDWACLQPLHLDAADPLGPYIEAVAREHGLNPDQAAAGQLGWCSWYHYYQNISAPIILENLEQAAELRRDLQLDLVQIDDGWQTQIGDWDRFSPGFPDGPAPVAAAIRARGLTPGLWLAPFIVHPRSAVAAERKAWLLRGPSRLPVNAGFVWNSFTRALDLSIPAALDYAAESVRRAAHDWGFPYLKLDFLYAGALPGRRADRLRTRAEILRSALERLRAAAGDSVELLACGCPLGPAIGLFDAMRVNADVAPYWKPRYFNTERFFAHEPDFPAARNAVQNALSRAPLHRRWWTNDADCLLLRLDTQLTLAEVQSLAAVIAMTGGPLLLSDDLAALPPERLRIARQLAPLIGRRPFVLDWIDSTTPSRLQLNLDGPEGGWHLLALFNWDDRPREIALRARDFFINPSRDYFVREFWTGEVSVLAEGSASNERVAAHGCRVLALRPRLHRPQYLGGDVHISQGLELARWQVAPGLVSLSLRAQGAFEGAVDLHLPGMPVGIELEQVAGGVYRLPVAFQQAGEYEIRFG